MSEEYTLCKKRRDNWNQYTGNELVTEHDALIDTTVEKLRELDKAISGAGAGRAALSAITARYEVFVRPAKEPGRYTVHCRLVNGGDFAEVRERHGVYGPTQRTETEFYRKGGLLCTVHCSAGGVNDKTPCSAGDWARIEAGDIPKVFLEKKENSTVTVVQDPVKVKAEELKALGIRTMEQFDAWMAKIGYSRPKDAPQLKFEEFREKTAYIRPVLQMYLGDKPKPVVIVPDRVKELLDAVAALDDGDRNQFMAELK
jgi:hypothetical protein